jgi:FixJ family two-component response regulator
MPSERTGVRGQGQFVNKISIASADAKATMLQDLPQSNRWSLGDVTLCGQHGYLRPCQRQDCSNLPRASFPHSPICKTDMEIVFVVDDDQQFCADLVELLESLGYAAIACTSAAELQAQLPNYKTGCVLLDVRMPGQDGMAVQEWMNRANITLPVVFISGVQDIATVVHCLKAGAFEFIQKPFGEMALSRVVSAAIGISRSRYCRLESERMVAVMIDSLTPTENVVAKMISKGFPTKLIAAEMGRSENTVKIHRHRIFNKLKVNSAASVANIMRHVSGDTGDDNLD